MTSTVPEDHTGAALPPHQDRCFGCGPGNSAGLGIAFTRAQDGVVGVLTLDERHQGAPGVAHGGVVAAALDEAAGSALLPLGLPAVTAQLDVSYHAPVPIGRTLTVRSRLDERAGRKLRISAELELDGSVVARARVLFIEVQAEHFLANGAAPGDLPALGI
ncbi:PaaI family thioesterase [Nocardia terpenica]|uniref:PaaI family thioesterase n=1 Tax=Nocardia terpenica TaxID=455432 RepID=UPI002FE38C95